MNKKLLALSVLSMATITSVAFASPLVNYDQGNAAVTIGASISPDAELETSGKSVDFDASTAIYGIATVGLGDNWGIGYKYKKNNIDDNSVDADLKAHQFNVYYKAAPGLTAFAGYDKSDYNGTVDGASVDDSNNGFHAGIIGRAPLALGWSAWGLIGAGNKLNEYEVGISKTIFVNTELDLSYSRTEYKDLSNVDFTSKGVNLGLTFKF